MKENPVNASELNRWLSHQLSVDELEDLCRALNIDFEDLPGVSKNAKTRELILRLKRYGRLSDLFEVGKRLRTDIDWNQWRVSDRARAEDMLATAGERPLPDNVAELRIESPSIHSVVTLDLNFLQFRKFVQEAFTLDELLKFIDRSEEFKGFRFNLPLNASHNSVTRELFAYAQRHGMIILLREKLEDAKPDLYEKYGPFIEAGQLRVNVTLVIKGDATRLKALQAKPLGEEFEQRVLQASKKAFFQAI